MTLKEKIVNLLKDQPGLSDREITNDLPPPKKISPT